MSKQVERVSVDDSNFIDLLKKHEHIRGTKQRLHSLIGLPPGSSDVDYVEQRGCVEIFFPP